ncbi:MAG: mannose-6-phosphate isomerase, class I [Myxococcota bacterium]|nr:mannose-6-phosphate isomerase, class I [Myxococcota bacterium]
MLDQIHLLSNPIRDYAWGSRQALAELTGRPAPAPGPEAELWMGAHPSSPSTVRSGEGEVPLDAWIRRDPSALLGAAVAERFGGELPFLFKVVAPDQALSIQSHPDAAQAREGFARENAAGMPLDDPARSYRDPHHKPELVCALTPFEALCGFRPIGEIQGGVAALGLPSLRQALAALGRDRTRRGLARFFGDVMTRAPEARRELAHEVAEEAARGAGEPRACALVVSLAKQYPGDPGVLAPLLLNQIELAPGEGLFLPAGELHCYLRGTAVEVMANSDNVLRGGLTPKHVDVPELLRTLSFRSGRPPVLRPCERAPGEAVYEAPVAEFHLSVLRPEPGRPVVCEAAHSAEILFCAEGAAEIVDLGRNERTPLARGAAAFVPACAASHRLEGRATVYRVGVPR